MEKLSIYHLKLNYKDIYQFVDSNDSEIEVGKNAISISLLKYFLSDEFYDTLVGIYQGKYRKIRINLMGEDTTISIESFSLSFLYLAYLKLFSLGKLDNHEVQKLSKIKELVCFEKFMADYQNEEMFINVDGIDCEVSIKDILSFLMLDEKDYKKMLHRKWFNGTLLMTHFLYIIKKLFMDDTIVDKYILPDIVLERYVDIFKSKDVDIEAINQVLETDDVRVHKIKLDEEFEKEILDSIPDCLDSLEKAIYLYILLCRTLSYDQIYFAYNDTSSENAHHAYIEYLEKVNKKNSYVVCFEFNALYGYFLNKLGIKYVSYGNVRYDVHASLMFRVGKFMVKADSVTSILAGDMVRSKTLFPLNGLRVENKNIKTQDEFYDILKRVYGMFYGENEEIDVDINLSLIDKLKQIIQYINTRKLQPVDKYGYVYLLKKKFFTEYESNNFSYLVLIKDKHELCGVFSIKENDEYRYFWFFDNTFEELSEERIKEMLETRELMYIVDSTERIPFKNKSDQKIINKKLDYV